MEYGKYINPFVANEDDDDEEEKPKARKRAGRIDW